MWDYRPHFTDEKAEVPGGGSALPKVTELVQGGAVLIPGLSLPCVAHETEPVLLSLAPEAHGDLAPAPSPDSSLSLLLYALVSPSVSSFLRQAVTFLSPCPLVPSARPPGGRLPILHQFLPQSL